MTHGYLLYSKTNQNSFHTDTFSKSFRKQFFQTLLRTDTRVELKFWKKLFFKTHSWKANKPFWKHNEQVSKSPWITMDRKGANTFPFYKSTSRTEKLSHKEFCCAFVLSMLEKIKDGGDSCFRDISRTSVKQSVPDPPITELATLLGKILKWGVP